MAEITASLVKELREKTGAGMMDCKKALVDAGGDMEKAAEALRTKIPAPLLSFQYAASLNASPTTVEAMRQTLLPQLFAEAQKKAQGLATAAGLKLGAIKGVNESSYSTGGNYVNFIAGGTGLSSVSGSSVGSSGTQYTFFASISFGLAQ